MNAKTSKRLRKIAREAAISNGLPNEDYEKKEYTRVYQSLDEKWHRCTVYTAKAIESYKALYRDLKKIEKRKESK